RLRGYLSGLYEAASPDQREELNQQMTAWLPAATLKDSEEIRRQARRYLRCFDFHPSAVRARQSLIGALDPRTDGVEFERELHQLAEAADPQVAASAAAKLVRRWLDRRRFDDVSIRLPEFEGRFAELECEPGLTGRKFAENIRADEGFAEFSKWERAWP